MQDSKTQRPDERVVDADATSKVTLADLEENEASSDSESEPAGKPNVPSPDGAIDEQKKTKDAGPM